MFYSFCIVKKAKTYFGQLFLAIGTGLYLVIEIQKGICYHENDKSEQIRQALSVMVAKPPHIVGFWLIHWKLIS